MTTTPNRDWIVIDGWCRGRPLEVYNMISGDTERPSSRTNSMRQMRAAFDLPAGNEYIHEWLVYWDSLNSDQRKELRRMDLSTLPISGIPTPPQPQGVTS